MEAIKKYFTSWDFSRGFKMILGLLMIIGYISTKESIYLMGGVFFAFQAILNIGCPGGVCASPPTKCDQNQVMKFDKYEPNKEQKNV